MSAPEREVDEWLLRAKSDLLSIENNVRSVEIPWNIVVFHAQQVCEKLLKALIIKDGHIPPRTHDLVPLLNMCPQVSSQSTSLLSDMDKLMLLFGSRYPDTRLPSEAEGRAAVAVARRMMDIVVSMIGPKQ
jgi:HEPN domain-containing protein